MTCSLTQQWESMESAVTIVPTPCLMNSTRPIRSASSMSCGHRPVQHAKQKSQRQRHRAETLVNERAELGQGPAQVRESRVSVESDQSACRCRSPSHHRARRQGQADAARPSPSRGEGNRNRSNYSARRRGGR